MKAEILKIAGVKSEKEFYKKFPTEESFIKVHGKALKKAQMGAMIQGNQPAQSNPRPINFQQLYDQNDMYITGSTQDMRNKQAQDQASLAAQQKMANKKSGIADAIGQIGKIAGDMSKSDSGKNGKKLKKAQSGIEDLVGKAGGPMAVAQSAGNIVGGIQQMKGEKDLMKQTQQWAKISGVGLEASQTSPEPVERKYVRPDSPGNMTQPGELYNPLGYGTNILAAKNGGEIANTFAPNTIYTDLGYAAVGGNFSNFGNQDFMKNATGKNAVAGQQSDIYKFAEQGGGDAISQLTSSIGNPKGYGPSGASRVGGGVGKIAGTIFGGPVGGLIGEKFGQIGGDILSKTAEDTEKARGVLDRNLDTITLNQSTQGLQQQNSANMRDGGMANPQIINQFGNYKLSQLLQPDPTMDTLRAGGHLQNYTAPSERAMYTGREQFAMGGKLKTHWGGYAEPISYNPYLPEEGETVMFRGNSHDESDGKGRTGIGASYGNTGSDSYTDYAEYGTDSATGKASVEVEEEPAVQLKDGTTGDTSLTVYGNLELSEPNAELIGMPDQANKKYKNIVADLAKKEQKQNKIIEKSLDELSNLDTTNPYDLLYFNSLTANKKGADANLKMIASQKIKLADMQSATNDTAEEYGFEADALAKGKVKQAKKGASIKKAQDGDISDKIYRDALALQPLFAEEVEPITNLDQVTVSGKRIPSIEELRNRKLIPSNVPFFTGANAEAKEKDEFDWMTIFNQILPYLRPTDAEALDPRQLSGEMLALAQNQLEPVQAQTFQPQLSTPYDISLQDILNENEADYRAAVRSSGGYNPAALAFLNAQKYGANQKVLGEQFRLNQGMKNQVYDENRAALNESNLQNLGILDQQYVRQQGALSNTKATAQAALNSISAKYLQNQASNRELQAYENLYNFRSGPMGVMQNMNPLAQFNTALGNFSADQIEEILKLKRDEEAKKNKPTVTRNGGLVKAIKSM